MKKYTTLLAVATLSSLVSLSAFAQTIVCSHDLNKVVITLESGQGKIWKMTLVSENEVELSGNASVVKPEIGNTDTVFDSTRKAEGEYTNGELPSWRFTIDGNNNGSLEIFSNSLSNKLSFIHTGNSYPCTFNE